MSETKKHDINGEDLYLRACLLDVFVEGIFSMGENATIQGKYKFAFIPFFQDFIKDLELLVYDEPFWDKCDD